MNFKIFPILKTERLTLRQVTTDDELAILALRSDTDVSKYLGRPLCNSTEDALKFINNVNDNFEKNLALYWAITLTETKTLVGAICLFDFSSGNNSCEIGYELMTEFQGQGLMKEAVQEILYYAFQTLKFKKIVAFTHCENQNSTKLLSKFNFIKSTETFKENPDLTIFTLTQ